MSERVCAGTLYLVSTPIGNLGDITYRALDILQGVDLVAAEDTRTTRILLEHYGLHKTLISYHSHNEVRRSRELIAHLQNGKSIGLTTDAGTPGISDPAGVIVRAAIGEGIPVVPLPGPSAALPALIVSGLPTDRFVFEGFLPVKKGRRTRLMQLAQDPRTIIMYESPFRVERTLRDIRDIVGERQAAVVRELTKKFEEVVRGTVSQVLTTIMGKPSRGEYVIVLAGTAFAPDGRETMPSGSHHQPATLP